MARLFVLCSAALAVASGLELTGPGRLPEEDGQRLWLMRRNRNQQRPLMLDSFPNLQLRDLPLGNPNPANDGYGRAPPRLSQSEYGSAAMAPQPPSLTYQPAPAPAPQADNNIYVTQPPPHPPPAYPSPATPAPPVQQRPQPAYPSPAAPQPAQAYPSPAAAPAPAPSSYPSPTPSTAASYAEQPSADSYTRSPSPMSSVAYQKPVPPVLYQPLQRPTPTPAAPPVGNYASAPASDDAAAAYNQSPYQQNWPIADDLLTAYEQTKGPAPAASYAAATSASLPAASSQYSGQQPENVPPPAAPPSTAPVRGSSASGRAESNKYAASPSNQSPNSQYSASAANSQPQSSDSEYTSSASRPAAGNVFAPAPTPQPSSPQYAAEAPAASAPSTSPTGGSSGSSQQYASAFVAQSPNSQYPLYIVDSDSNIASPLANQASNNGQQYNMAAARANRHSSAASPPRLRFGRKQPSSAAAFSPNRPMKPGKAGYWFATVQLYENGQRWSPPCAHMCADTQPFCPSWAAVNECEVNGPWMRDNCCGSCRLRDRQGVHYINVSQRLFGAPPHPNQTPDDPAIQMTRDVRFYANQPNLAGRAEFLAA